MQLLNQLMQPQQQQVNQDQQLVGQQQQGPQQQQQQQNGFAFRRRNFFHFDGTRYFSWLPSFSVEGNDFFKILTVLQLTHYLLV